jgi:hypothetical protein
VARPRSTASVRRQLADALAEELSEDDFRELIRAAKGAETSAAAECPECGHSMRVKVPDFKKQFELYMVALEQTEGKASQAVPDATTVVVERPPR